MEEKHLKCCQKCGIMFGTLIEEYSVCVRCWYDSLWLNSIVHGYQYLNEEHSLNNEKRSNRLRV